VSDIEIKRPESVDTSRFRRFMAGETFEEQAEAEGVFVQTIVASVERASRREQMIRHAKLMELKQQGQLQNERFRAQIRERLSGKVAEAIEKLLRGQKDKVTVDKATGQVTIEQIVDDPEAILAGIIEYKKFTSLEQKPAAAVAAQVQNNAAINNTTNQKAES
jgi:hypothetical protein